jgi:hypothetical protein
MKALSDLKGLSTVLKDAEAKFCGVGPIPLLTHSLNIPLQDAALLSELINAGLTPRVTNWHKYQGEEMFTIDNDNWELLFGKKSLRRVIDRLEKGDWLTVKRVNYNKRPVRGIKINTGSILYHLNDLVARWVFQPPDTIKRLSSTAPEPLPYLGWWCYASGSLNRALSVEPENTLLSISLRMKGQKSNEKFLQDLQAYDPRHTPCGIEEPTQLNWCTPRNRRPFASARINEVLAGLHGIGSIRDDTRWIGGIGFSKDLCKKYLGSGVEMFSLQAVGTTLRLYKGDPHLEHIKDTEYIVKNMPDCWASAILTLKDQVRASSDLSRAVHKVLEEQYVVMNWLDSKINAENIPFQELFPLVVVKNGGYADTSQLVRLGLLMRMFPEQMALAHRHIGLKGTHNNESAIDEFHRYKAEQIEAIRAFFPAVIYMLEAEEKNGWIKRGEEPCLKTEII